MTHALINNNKSVDLYRKDNLMTNVDVIVNNDSFSLATAETVFVSKLYQHK